MPLWKGAMMPSMFAGGGMNAMPMPSSLMIEVAGALPMAAPTMEASPAKTVPYSVPAMVKKMPATKMPMNAMISRITTSIRCSMAHRASMSRMLS